MKMKTLQWFTTVSYTHLDVYKRQVRISLDDDNDMGQIEQFLTIFKQVYEKTQKVR